MMKSSQSRHAGGRNVIVCCDGTGIHEDHTTGQAVTPSNVLKIFNCIDVDSVDVAQSTDGGGDATELRDQIAFYERGVASIGNILAKAGGGMTGYGINKKIMVMYHWLTHNWQNHEGDGDDRLFLFGFSRGAFAVRSLMGMIYRVGLLDLRGLDYKESSRRVGIAFKHGYMKGRPQNEWACGSKDANGKKLDDPWKFHGDEQGRIPVHFIGAFDTVGQLGLPRETVCLWSCGFLCNVRSSKHKYHDVKINELTKAGRHAVAMDEMRSTFQPVFSREYGKNREKFNVDIRQVWFPGAHGNIGGGLVDCGLSDGALKWMIDEASKYGLRFKENMTSQIRPNYKGSIYYTHGVSIYKSLTFYPRSVPPVIPENSEANKPDDLEAIHESAIQRSQDPPISDAPYYDTKFLREPGDTHHCVIRADKKYNPTYVYLEEGTYSFKAEGEWICYKGRACGPDGYRTNLLKQPISFTLSVGLGRIQRGWRRLTGNREALLPLTRRHDHSRWGVVRGMIASGGTRDAVAKAEFHKTFEIGERLDNYEVKGHGGYLFCYVNDTWGSYTDNKGVMDIFIERVK